jgi:hypothetical protein
MGAVFVVPFGLPRNAALALSQASRRESTIRVGLLRAIIRIGRQRIAPTD